MSQRHRQRELTFLLEEHHRIAVAAHEVLRVERLVDLNFALNMQIPLQNTHVFRLAQRFKGLLEELLKVLAERRARRLVAEGVLQHVRLLLDRVA